jgi:hypothetical protein
MYSEMGSHPKIGKLILLHRHLPFKDRLSSPTRKVLLGVLGFLTGALIANKQVGFHSATLVSR